MAQMIKTQLYYEPNMDLFALLQTVKVLRGQTVLL